MKIKYFLFLFFLIVFIKTQFQNIENNNSTSFKKFGLQNETLNQESNKKPKIKCITKSCQKNNIIQNVIVCIIIMILPFLIVIKIYWCIKKKKCLKSNIINESEESKKEEDTYSSNEKIILKKYFIIHNILIKKIYDNEMIKNGDECCICLEKFVKNENDICLVPCNHLFHFSCIKNYIISSDDTYCPYCKFDFFSLIKQEKKDINFNEDVFNI